MAEKKISAATLKKAWIRWFFWHGSSQQAETMLGNSVASSLAPVITELYTDKEQRVEAYKRSLTLFNTEQQIGAICPGIFCGMEEANANGNATPEVVQAVKVALIGPTSAIGDSLWVATLIPILLTICMAVTNAAGWVGPVLYMVAYPVGTAIISWNLWKLGYRTGLDGIHRFMASGRIEQITQAMTILGLLVVGALTASFVSVTIPVSIVPPGGESAIVPLDTLINSIFPKLLPLLLTVFVYRLYAKKKVPPMAIMGLILLFAIILTLIGWLTGAYVF